MNRVHLKDLPIIGLEYLFSPLGLPLVEKTPIGVPTTTILARGEAGAGKTTLAVALAHAIARQNQGLTIYLSSESFPVELVYKAQMLGLSEGQVLGWDARADGQVGSIVAEHLNRTEAGRDPATIAEQHRSVVEALLGLVEQYISEQHSVPLRAVVVDAFGLPEEGEEEIGTRTQILSLLQALESRGISTVIVEELGASSTEALSFVVDIAFGLNFASDPDTGELVRKLRCPKSRYAIALAGPHDYGLDNGRPAVWPDVLAVMNSGNGLAVEFAVKQGKLARLFRPMGGRSYQKLAGGNLIISDHVAWALADTPGNQPANVTCGPFIIVEVNDVERVFSVGEGPFFFAWHLLRAIREDRVNTVTFGRLDQLLSRQRFSATLLHVLDTLRRLGVLVLIHGVSANLERLYSLADLLQGRTARGEVSHHLAKSIQTMPERWHRSALLWLIDAFRVEMEQAVFPVGIAALQDLQAKTDQAKALFEDGRLSEAVQVLHLNLDAIPPSGATLLIRCAQILVKCGALERARLCLGRAQGSLAAALIGHGTLAWSHYLLGQESEAAQIAEQALKTQPHPDLRLLWNGLCAFYAGTPFINPPGGSPDLAMVLLLRDIHQRQLPNAQAAREIDDVIDNLLRSTRQPPWFTRRVKADLGLESDQPEIITGARDALRDLSSDPSLPLVHKAEVLHNLGIAEERLGNKDAAIAALQQALEVNPMLEISRAKLLALGVSPPAVA